jgi:hypothetical protein
LTGQDQTVRTRHGNILNRDAILNQNGRPLGFHRQKMRMGRLTMAGSHRKQGVYDRRSSTVLNRQLLEYCHSFGSGVGWGGLLSRPLACACRTMCRLGAPAVTNRLSSSLLHMIPMPYAYEHRPLRGTRISRGIYLYAIRHVTL